MVIYGTLPRHDWRFTPRKVEDLTLRPQREKMTSERKMGAVNSACGTSWLLVILLLERETEREQ